MLIVSLEKNLFIQALTIARQRKVKQIRSVNISNFVGAEQKLLSAFSEMDYAKIDFGGD